MAYFYTVTAWLATIAGLIFTLISSLPDVWTKSEIASWIWGSSGWLVSFLLCVFLSIEKYSFEKQNKNKQEKYQKLRARHVALTEKAKLVNEKLQESNAERKALFRSNSYLLDRLEQSKPKEPIKRKLR